MLIFNCIAITITLNRCCSIAVKSYSAQLIQRSRIMDRTAPYRTSATRSCTRLDELSFEENIESKHLQLLD